ncbi:MAG: DMT family transporter [Pseudomonadota bacterium]
MRRRAGGSDPEAEPSAAASLAAMLDRPRFLLVLATLFWASNAIAGQLAVGEVSPMVLTFLRWSLVSVGLWALFWRDAAPTWPVARRHAGRIIAMAAVGFAGFNALFYAASTATTAINIGVLQGSTPAFVLAGAVLAAGARLDRGAALGVAVTLLGVLTVAAQGAPLRLLEIGLNPGDALMLAACVCYAAYAVALPSRPAMPALAFFMWLAPCAGLAAAPLALAEVSLGLGQAPTAQGWLITLWIAVFPSCLSQLCFLRAVDQIGPQQAGVYGNLVPVFTPVLAVLVLGQAFHIYHAAALTLVLGGLWLAQRGPREIA